jgi:hypothetical protein
MYAFAPEKVPLLVYLCFYDAIYQRIMDFLRVHHVLTNS